MEWLHKLYQSFFGTHVLVSPGYLAVFGLLAWAIYLYRRETDGFIAWLLPRAIWTHASTRTDMTLFVIGRLMSFFGIIARFGGVPIMAAFVAGLLPAPALGRAPLSPLLLALVFFLVSDFAVYWSHRAHHTIRQLWPLHAVHHSAAVLTPFTAYRQHPLGLLVSAAFQSVIVGSLYGLLIGVFDPTASLAKIAGVNAFLVITNLTVANFHHSHIWISFGPIIERLIISPAQHQIHHSTNPAHFNKNYGGTLAIWDWFFGTLYLTGAHEDIQLGLKAKADAPLMTHRLGSILINPVQRMLRPHRR